MDGRPNVDVDHRERDTDLRHEHLKSLYNGAAEDTAQSRKPDFG